MIVRKMFVSRLTSRIGIDEPVVFHVGEPAEFAAWSIPRAIKILLTDLAASISVLASDRELLAVYATGAVGRQPQKHFLAPGGGKR